MKSSCRKLAIKKKKKTVTKFTCFAVYKYNPTGHKIVLVHMKQQEQISCDIRELKT